MTKKRGLGRGLDALMGDNKKIEKVKDKESDILKLDIDLISPNKDQPRREFNEKTLEELADSIKEYGVIQPIIVRKVGSRYEIIAGERRYRASKLANLKEIPSIIMEASEEDAAKLALVENIQREDLNAIEEAMAYKELLEAYDLTQGELGEALGKSRSYISNTLRLLNLDEETLEYIREGTLTVGHGKVLLSIEDEKERKKIVEEIIDKKLSVRATEDLIKRLKNKEEENEEEKEEESKTEENLGEKQKDPYILDLEDEFMRTLGTKVNIVEGKNINKLEIEYYTDEDLERIYNIIIDELE